MILTTLLSSALLMSTTPAPAADRVTVHIPEADYVRSVDAEGNLQLKGQYLPSNQPFRFRVDKDGYVRGWVGDTAVEFHVNDVGNRTD